METGLWIIFWYGILHAFGPDHLSAIADFSIGRSKKRTFIITLSFAVGHGLMLYIFAKILSSQSISPDILAYADSIAALIIIGMGVYMLMMVYLDRVHLNTHVHNGQHHIHIWFGKEHNHHERSSLSAFGIGTLMGIGGVRGMLITLSVVNTHAIDAVMIIAFILGAMVVFVGFGGVIYLINTTLLHNKSSVKKVIATAGGISMIIGLNMIHF
ncbi:hypothetical protein PGH07_03030 [Sulfurovum sp. zt1-1]|uniref:Nickel and cobalt efflux transporter rcnA n=1 Tax=Sulfurovum zhangzhouensis TaxID=3019067 RepID=A0ABT7QWC0_9BACT|nr:hypothetical protein [Sulfurovum zhangzhouensis]MDM5271139.1 hypothetical protein [Sulfurovum zhangzhouensis]